MANLINFGGGGTGGDVLLIPKTITENGRYLPITDSADGYSEVEVNVPRSSLDRLLFLECVGRDTPQMPAVNKLIKEDIFNEYLSFDDSTNKFTVLKSFDAVVVAWVYQYQGAMSPGQGAFYINDTETYTYNTNGNGLGAVGGVSNIIHFDVGDKFWVYTRSSSGYPQQYLKVYVEAGLTSGNAISPIGLSTNIQEIASLYFLNEISN